MKHFITTCILIFIFVNLRSQDLRPEIVDMNMNGTNLKSHFFTGYDNMQFSNADLDGDGREDLVVFDRQSAVVSTFLWDENNNEWQFAGEYRNIFPDDLRHWMLMRDYNKDGIADLFTSKYVAGSGIRVFKGVRQNGKLSFQPIQFYNAAEDRFFEELYYRNQSGAFRNLVVLTADIPAIADVDFDGDMDVLAFQESGNKVYYVKNTAVEQGLSLDSLHFQLEDRCWAGFAEDFLSPDIYTADAPGLCANQLKDPSHEKTPLHAFSTIAVYDVDGDEDVDVFIGDADLDKITFLNNEQTEDGLDWCNEQTLDFPENDVPIRMDAFLVPFFVNIDDDPETEMVLSSNQFNNSKNVIPMLTYDSEGGSFVLRDNDWFQLPQLDVGSKSHPALADVNQDGKLDLIVGNYLKYTLDSKPSLHLFINTSSDGQLSFELQDEDWLELSEQNDLNIQLKPAFGDLDQDGDLDLLVGQVAGELLFFENAAGEGNPFDFNPPIDLFNAQGSNAEVAPQIVDLDGDGLNDVVVGNAFGTL
ncbi:MAG TPA: VCBS repeat-containing protein, partial [Saprospiraceae bacterium]|nr:VCBS repeat-containing protein [Saprospiraceae bacterium]